MQLWKCVWLSVFISTAPGLSKSLGRTAEPPGTRFRHKRASRFSLLHSTATPSSTNSFSGEKQNANRAVPRGRDLHACKRVMQPADVFWALVWAYIGIAGSSEHFQYTEGVLVLRFNSHYSRVYLIRAGLIYKMLIPWSRVTRPQCTTLSPWIFIDFRQWFYQPEV